jgi:glycolate oxidase iron-sulfur subunit
MCGLCLPHCPTYRKTGDENESPRGRIALMRALAQGDLPLDSRMENHLGQCTACGACERVCPSYVGYAELLYATRAAIATRRREPVARRWVRHLLLDGLLTQARGLWLLKMLLRLYQASGLQGLLRKSPLPARLRRWHDLLPSPASDHLGATRSTRQAMPTRGKVALFTGCVASVVDAPTLRASIRVLQRLGYEVVQPQDQTCCGALHLHAGDQHRARALMQRNLRAFDDPALQAVIGVASGCTALLTQYPQHLADDPRAAAFSRRVQDINRFLAESPWPQDLRLKPLSKTIAVHEPCTLRNVLRGQEHVYTLLRRIPEAKVVALAENQFCCGGAGAYMLTQPAMADRLRDDKLAHLRQLAPDLLATSNVGCALHVGAGMRVQGMQAEAVHPVTLIARQLPD